MSVRVNLLPGEVAERNRAARQRAGAVGGAVVLVGALGLVYVWQVNRVGNAQADLEAQQARVAELQAEVTDLREYQELEQRLDDNEAMLAAALGSEASLAGVFQDLAAVMPTDAELTSVNVTLVPAGAAALGDVVIAQGNVALTGRTLRGHAPGLERLLLEFDKVAAFTDVFFSSSTVDADEVSSFAVEFDLGGEVYTLRYVDGLPEELR